MSQRQRDTLRHFVATLAYRTRKTIVGAPADFGSYAGAGKSPSQILSHMGDLMAWAISWFSEQRWNPENGPDWERNSARFFALLKELDALLSTDAPVRFYTDEGMLQGPLADAMTHVGQLAMLRRMAGSPTKPENFAEATVVIGDLKAPASAQSA